MKLLRLCVLPLVCALLVVSWSGPAARGGEDNPKLTAHLRDLEGEVVHPDHG